MQIRQSGFWVRALKQAPCLLLLALAYVPAHGLRLAVLALLLLGLFAQEYRLFERAWFNVQQWQQAAKGQQVAMLLSNYQVDIEAKVIEGLDDDVSALTYDPDRNSLFTVTNQKPQLIELSLGGELLRRIDLHGFGDAEAVEYISPGLYVITDERRQRLIKVRVDDTTTALHADQAQQLSLSIGLNGNKGFEGLAYDSAGQRLFVAKERDPLRIYEIHGFPQRDPQQPFALAAVQTEVALGGLGFFGGQFARAHEDRRHRGFLHDFQQAFLVGVQSGHFAVYPD